MNGVLHYSTQLSDPAIAVPTHFNVFILVTKVSIDAMPMLLTWSGGRVLPVTSPQWLDGMLIISLSAAGGPALDISNRAPLGMELLNPIERTLWEIVYTFAAR